MSWYRMERGWKDHEFFQKEPYSERDAWQWMIEEAAFKEKTIAVMGVPVRLKRGQFCHSVRFMAEKFQWSVGRVQRFIKRLQKWMMIITSTDTGQILISISNYSKYQDGRHTSDTSTDTPIDTPPDTQAGTNNKKDKEGKEIEGEKESAEAPAPAKVLKISSRGSRLPRDWVLPEQWGLWALTEGLTRQQVLDEEDKFRDYWIARSGTGASKVDWEATWRSWVRKSKEFKNVQKL